MDTMSLFGLVAMVVAGFTITLGTMMPAFGAMRSMVAALESMARQPDEADTITRTLFIGLALIESFAIYCFVVTMVFIFFNPFWQHVIQAGG